MSYPLVDGVDDVDIVRDPDVADKAATDVHRVKAGCVALMRAAAFYMFHVETTRL